MELSRFYMLWIKLDLQSNKVIISDVEYNFARVSTRSMEKCMNESLCIYVSHFQ